MNGNGRFKLEMGHLYELRANEMGKAWIHVMVVPPGVKDLASALKHYYQEEMQDADQYFSKSTR